MLAPGDALGSPESGPRACCLALRAGLASSDPRTRPGRGLGIHHEALCPPGLHSCLLPLLCGPQVQRMNVPRWGQRLGGPLGWADVPTYVSAASPRLPPRSRPLPPLAPPGLGGSAGERVCWPRSSPPGHVGFGGFCSAVGHQPRLCVPSLWTVWTQPAHARLSPVAPPLSVHARARPFLPRGPRPAPQAPASPAPPASRPPEAPSLTCCLTHSPPRPLPPLGPAGGRGRARGESLTWQPRPHRRVCREHGGHGGGAGRPRGPWERRTRCGR